MNPLIELIVDPKSTSFNNLCRSPCVTFELTTPNLNNSWYNSFPPLVLPPICKALYACLTASVSAKGIIPLAAAKAPALMKLRACVIGAKTVLAI